MSNISYLITVFTLLLPTVVVCQPYWWQPSAFYPEPNQPCTVSWVQGETFIAEPLSFNREQFESLDLVNVSGNQSVLAVWKNGMKEQLMITPDAKGEYLLVAQTLPVHSELSADSFNVFLKEYGQDEIYFTREATGKLQTAGQQVYSQHVKLLLQTGNVFDDVCKKPIGLPLEIIPEKNPTQLNARDLMRFKILYKGKPLFGARVKVWNRKDNRTTLQHIYTEKDGTIETRISTGGSWMVSVVHLVPGANNQATYRSYWSAFVFGLK